MTRTRALPSTPAVLLMPPGRELTVYHGRHGAWIFPAELVILTLDDGDV